MAMNHYLNGTAVALKIYKVGGPEVGYFGTKPTLTVDATAIGGSYIDMGAFFGSQGLIYFGGPNLGDGTSKDFSRFYRVRFQSISNNKPLGAFGVQGNNSSSGIDTYVDASGNLRCTMWNDSGLRGLNSVTVSTGFLAMVWYDIGWTWNNTTRDLKVYVNGVLIATINSTRTFSTGWTGLNSPYVAIGHSGNSSNTQIDLSESAFWDELVDFGPSGLNTNGAARTQFITYTAPTPLSWPGVGEVQTGNSWLETSGTSSGTLVVPAPAIVKSGEGYGAGGNEFIGGYIPVADPDVILMIDLEEDLEDFIVLLDSDADDDDLFAVVIEDDAILVIIEEKL